MSGFAVRPSCRRRLGREYWAHEKRDDHDGVTRGGPDANGSGGVRWTSAANARG